MAIIIFAAMQFGSEAYLPTTVVLDIIFSPSQHTQCKIKKKILTSWYFSDIDMTWHDFGIFLTSWGQKKVAIGRKIISGIHGSLPNHSQKPSKLCFQKSSIFPKKIPFALQTGRWPRLALREVILGYNSVFCKHQNNLNAKFQRPKRQQEKKDQPTNKTTTNKNQHLNTIMILKYKKYKKKSTTAYHSPSSSQN